MRTIRKWLQVLLYSMVLLGGYGAFLIFRRTPSVAYRSMVRLFCLTGGQSNDLLSRAIGLLEKRYHFRTALGVLGDMSDPGALKLVTGAIRERGYFQFENRLPEDLCDRLLKFAISQPSEAYQMDGRESDRPVAAVYPRENPLAVRYELRTQNLLENPDIQILLADLSFAAVAQEYLGARPVIDVLSMWWLTSFSDRPDAKAAQYFHFDMDRPKWLKFFIYLTEVKPSNGPHTFVAGSHRSGAIPDPLLKKGYARLTDEEVGRAFDQRDILEFSAPRGCILAEDTRGLHKGRHVEVGDRLMLQIQFSNSLFGGEYPVVSLGDKRIAALDDCIGSFPGLFSAYTRGVR